MFLIHLLSSATTDFDPQQITVSLSADQLQACVQVAIVDDTIVDPNEVFDVSLIISTLGVAIRQGREVAQVNIVEISKLISIIIIVHKYISAS